MGKLTISMAIFYSYVKLPEGIPDAPWCWNIDLQNWVRLLWQMLGFIPQHHGSHMVTMVLVYLPTRLGDSLW